MNFREAESYLLSLGNEVETMKLGLDNISKLLAALGNPQNNYLKVQVAGTNGKGSVCAFLDAICLEAKIKTGVFTSPHLVSITERVRVNGVDISEDDFARHATLVRDTAERMVTNGELEYTPTFFEQVTATALIAFAEAKIELAILETGLGGRLDATTAANPEIAAITRIDLDHQDYLGNTIEEIAAEKAAIIGPWTKNVVLGEQEPNVLKILLDRCRQFGRFPDSAQKSFMPVMNIQTKTKNVYEVDKAPPADLGVKLGLIGAHQIENAYTAVITSGVLLMDYDLHISDDQIRAGLKNARHPGRLEFNGRYLFDGAHNVGGAKVLVKFLDESVRQPITLIYGSMKDKDIAGFAEIVFPRALNVVLTDIGNSRSMTVEAIATAIPNTIYSGKVHLAASVGEALTSANELTEEDGLIVVTGSLYLVGEVKKLLKSQI